MSALLPCVAVLAAGGAPAGGLAPLGPGEHGVALACGRVLALDDEGSIHEPGMIVARNGKIVHVGEPIEPPPGFRAIELPHGWATPGQVDLHTHVHTSGAWGDLNDMVLPVNPELRASPTVIVSNALVKRACAGGVTTLFGIPGSGTSMSGFGVLYKAKPSTTYEDAVLADPGGLKVAQTHNPERRGGDLGRTRAGLYWMLERINERALASLESGVFDPVVADLARVHAGELPVLIHCAGSDGVSYVVRMWREQYDTRCVLSHGSFDGHRVARYVAEAGVPVNHGPRTMDFRSTRNGRINGSGAAYHAAGAPDFSLNTDSPVVPQEELFLQASMTAKLGADPYEMLRALTIHPARSLGIDERVGSLETGKDADVAVHSGDPLDPRSRVDLVLIDGRVEYDRERDGQWF